MQANDMLEYGNKIIKVLRDGTFLSEHFKKSDAATYDYLLKDASKFIQKIKSMTKSFNLSLFNEFLNYHQLIMQSILLI